MFNKEKRKEKRTKYKKKIFKNLNSILIFIVLGLSIINALIITKIITNETQIRIQDEKIRKLYEESLIINDLANKNYLKNLEFQQNSTMFYELYVVLQENNETKAYNIGKIAKEYSYFGNVINDAFNSKNIVFMLCPTFNVLSVYERENFNFNPSYIRYSCSRNAEWTMFMNERGDLYDVLFGTYRGNYFEKEESSEQNSSSKRLNPIHYKIMNRKGVLSLENIKIYD
ncbi:MAG: hypothetical protein ACP5OZ_04650 [Candidatus Woesearchaeota archaeon]